jgi:hypothetical protein
MFCPPWGELRLADRRQCLDNSQCPAQLQGKNNDEASEYRVSSDDAHFMILMPRAQRLRPEAHAHPGDDYTARPSER